MVYNDAWEWRMILSYMLQHDECNKYNIKWQKLEAKENIMKESIYVTEADKLLVYGYRGQKVITFGEEGRVNVEDKL